MIPFDNRLRAALAVNLEAHQRHAQPLEGRRHAAVAVVLVDSDPVRHAGATVGVAGGAALLLCQRASGLRRHAGQWALPGGRIEAGETPIEAALRELDEEIGIRLNAGTVIGWLDDYPTRSGYVITPVVVWGGSDPPMKTESDEVLAVYRVTLQALIDAEARFVAIPER